MPRYHQNLSPAKIFLSLMLLLFVSAASPKALAQEKTWADSSTPLVYGVENTGAHYPAPVFPSFEQLPIIRPLPDPFVFFNDGDRDDDGHGWFGGSEHQRRDTSFASWERRRNQIKAAIENYEIGPKPDCHDCTITATYTPAAAGSNAGSLQVVVTRNGKSVTLNERVWLPQGMGNGPFPVLIPMSLAFPPFFVPPVPNYGALPSSVFSTRPIATIDYFHNDVTVYSFFGVNDHSKDPFYQLYPELCAGKCTATSTSGQYAAWSWGVSRLIDGIEIATHQAVNPLPIDVKHIAVTGCSYAGKMALFAGALDERIGLTISQENGGGGAPAWRVTDEVEAGGASEDIQRTDYNWFAGQMKQFSLPNVYKLPVDHHELMAMVAPRALLETGNTDFYWLSNRSNYVAARATQRVFNALGIGDRFGFYIDGGHNHCATLPAEAPAIAAFVDKFMLGNMSVSTDVEVNPYPTLDYQRWTWWWGKGEPRFPTNWNPGDGTVVMSLRRPLDIDSGDTVMAGFALSMPGSHPAATVALTGGNVQTDVSCMDGSSYTLSIPIPDQSFSIQANDGSWLPSADRNSPLVYQGSATAAAACRGGFAKSAYFSALGETTGIGNPPAAPGFGTTDTTDPLSVKFHCTDNDSDHDNHDGGSWSPTVDVKH